MVGLNSSSTAVLLAVLLTLPNDLVTFADASIAEKIVNLMSTGGVGSEDRPIFTMESLSGECACHNHIPDVGSCGIACFDGAGGVQFKDLRVNCQEKNPTRFITDLGAGTGTYVVSHTGNGTIHLEFPDFDDLDYEFVVIESDELREGAKKVVRMQSYLTTAGLDGQLVAPLWSLV